MLFYFAWNSECILPRISELVLLIFFFFSKGILSGFKYRLFMLPVDCFDLQMRSDEMQFPQCWTLPRVPSAPVTRPKIGKRKFLTGLSKAKPFPIVWKQNAQNNSSVVWWDESEWRKKRTQFDECFCLFYLWSNRWEIKLYSSLSMPHLSGELAKHRGTAEGKNCPWSGL